jgi:hypothetical protein
MQVSFIFLFLASVLQLRAKSPDLMLNVNQNRKHSLTEMSDDKLFVKKISIQMLHSIGKVLKSKPRDEEYGSDYQAFSIPALIAGASAAGPAILAGAGAAAAAIAAVAQAAVGVKTTVDAVKSVEAAVNGVEANEGGEAKEGVEAKEGGKAKEGVEAKGDVKAEEGVEAGADTTPASPPSQPRVRHAAGSGVFVNNIVNING